jgi:hypothetical protein
VESTQERVECTPNRIYTLLETLEAQLCGVDVGVENRYGIDFYRHPPRGTPLFALVPSIDP